MNSYTQFTLTQLEYVMAVHKQGHFGKAAESCHVTQPTLSMQIKKLEDDLGIIIFDRSKKPILLTEAGQKVIEQIKLVLFEAKKIESLAVSEEGDVAKGELILGVIPTIAPYLLPRLLPKLDKLFPDLQLTIFEMQTQRMIEALNNDEIDVGLLATPLKIARIHEYPLYYEPFWVLCQKNHELAQHKKLKYSMMKFEDLWLLEEGHCLRHQILDVCSLPKEKKQKRKYKFESGNIETLKNLVNAYGGFTLLPTLANDSIGGRSMIIPFERPIPAREVGLVYRREFYKHDLIEALGQGILASIPEEIRKIRPKDLDVLPVE